MTDGWSSPYNGDGTFIRKITIIMSPMKSFAMTPVRPPRNVPQPARPAFMISFPPISSPAIAPITDRKNHDHNEPDEKFRDDAGQTAQKRAPARTAGFHDFFPAYKFARDRANYRSEKSRS